MTKPITLILLFFLCSFFLSCKRNDNNAGITTDNKIIVGEFYNNYGHQAICKTSENNIAIVALKGYPSHLYVAMLNSNLDILWEKTFDSQIDNAGGITGTEDGGVIIASNQLMAKSKDDTKYCLDIRKLNSKGEVQWDKNYFFLSQETLSYPIRETPDRGFIIAVVNTLPDTVPRLFPTLFKINATGDSLWSKTVHRHFNCIATDIGIAPDGGFLVTGPCSVYKTDSLGNTEWWSEDFYQSTTIQVLKDGSFVALNTSEFDDHYSRLCKADANGIKVWEKIYSDEESLNIYNIYPSKENGFVFTDSDYGLFRLIKTDALGNKLSESTMASLGSWGLILFQNKYCCYTYSVNSSTRAYNLMLTLIN